MKQSEISTCNIEGKTLNGGAARSSEVRQPKALGTKSKAR
jgi:hypothetical protein